MFNILEQSLKTQREFNQYKAWPKDVRKLIDRLDDVDHEDLSMFQLPKDILGKIKGELKKGPWSDRAKSLALQFDAEGLIRAVDLSRHINKKEDMSESINYYSQWFQKNYKLLPGQSFWLNSYRYIKYPQHFYNKIQSNIKSYKEYYSTNTGISDGITAKYNIENLRRYMHKTWR